MSFKNRKTGEIVEAQYLIMSDELDWDLSIDDMVDFLDKNGIDASVYDFGSFITLDWTDADLDVHEGSYVIINNGVVTTLFSRNFWEEFEEVVTV